MYAENRGSEVAWKSSFLKVWILNVAQLEEMLVTRMLSNWLLHDLYWNRIYIFSHLSNLELNKNGKWQVLDIDLNEVRLLSLNDLGLICETIVFFPMIWCLNIYDMS